MLVATPGCVCATSGVQSASAALDGSATYDLTVELAPGASLPSDFVLLLEVTSFQPGDPQPVSLVLSRDGTELASETSAAPRLFDPSVRECGSPCTYEVEVGLAFEETRSLSLYAGHEDPYAYDCVDEFVEMTLTRQ
jgi:hypothetical protein